MRQQARSLFRAHSTSDPVAPLKSSATKPEPLWSRVAARTSLRYDCRVARLDQLTPGTSVKGILPDCLITVVSVQWFGSQALELTYKDPDRKSVV